MLSNIQILFIIQSIHICIYFRSAAVSAKVRVPIYCNTNLYLGNYIQYTSYTVYGSRKIDVYNDHMVAKKQWRIQGPPAKCREILNNSSLSH